MKKYISLLIVFFSVQVYSQTRVIPSNIEVQKVKINFNGDCLNGFYRVIDARTDQEKEKNRNENKLSGEVITFFHGHLQRADDAKKLIDRLALNSKSGIVVVPITYTPFGKERKYRGDSGKDYILMEIIRHVLDKKGIAVANYSSISKKIVKINGKVVKNSKEAKSYIETLLVSVGWSHGGLLARRMVSRYPASFNNLVQIASAGFYSWGNKSCLAPGCVLMNFSWEGLGILGGVFRGEGSDIVGASWGITKGLVGDTLWSVPSCIWGNFHLFKPLRSYQDIQDVTDQLTDDNFPVLEVNNVIVLIAENDSLFSPENVTDINGKITKDKLEPFWEKFYPVAKSNGVNLRFRVMPGNHLGPVIHYKKYCKEILEGTNQLK